MLLKWVQDMFRGPPGPPGPTGATGATGDSYVHGYFVPSDFPEATNSLGAPIDWDETRGECLSLPVQKLESGGYLSRWKLGEREIELTILSNAHPVVSIKSIT